MRKQTHPTVVPPSRSQVNKAARALRAMSSGPATAETLAGYATAIATISAYRAQFGAPLVKVNVGLRGFCTTLRIEGATVTQRLKREETIREKLGERETTMSLASMHDIGGCRVVIPGTKLDAVADLRRLQKHVEQRWDIKRVYDYIAEPRVSGYRAVHVVVVRDGYPIEIQLRTERMHLWAQTVESFSGHYSVNYKQDGDADIQVMMAALSRVDQALEADAEVDPEDLDTIRTIAGRVRESL